MTGGNSIVFTKADSPLAPCARGLWKSLARVVSTSAEKRYTEYVWNEDRETQLGIMRARKIDHGGLRLRFSKGYPWPRKIIQNMPLVIGTILLSWAHSYVIFKKFSPNISLVKDNFKKPPILLSQNASFSVFRHNRPLAKYFFPNMGPFRPPLCDHKTDQVTVGGT